MTKPNNNGIPFTPSEAHRLHFNENPFPLPQNIKREMEEAAKAAALNLYPDAAMRAFYGALAAQTGYPEEMLVATNGLEEMILLLLVAFGKMGPVVLPSPTFFVYKQVATSLGLEILELPLLADTWQLDLPLILREAGDLEGLLILCRPNNPTGNVFSRTDIMRILSETRLLVVLDEAYYGFTEETMLDDVMQHERLLVLRTFSKTYGLAGLRLGYMVAEPPLIEKLNQFRPTFNLNVLTAALGVVALKHEAELLARVPAIVAEREWLGARLSELPGVFVYPSETNFLLIKTHAAAAQARLREENIMVRLEKPNFLRISVGERGDHEQLLRVLSTFLQ